MTRNAPDSTPVTIRVPARLLRKIETRAAAAQTSRSAYIVSRLSNDAPDSSPSLAALSRLIAIHALVERSNTVSADHLRELSELIDRLSLAAHHEFGR